MGAARSWECVVRSTPPPPPQKPRRVKRATHPTKPHSSYHRTPHLPIHAPASWGVASRRLDPRILGVVSQSFLTSGNPAAQAPSHRRVLTVQMLIKHTQGWQSVIAPYLVEPTWKITTEAVGWTSRIPPKVRYTDNFNFAWPLDRAPRRSFNHAPRFYGKYKINPNFSQKRCPNNCASAGRRSGTPSIMHLLGGGAIRK